VNQKPKNLMVLALCASAILSMLAWLQFDSSRAFAGEQVSVQLPLEPPIRVVSQFRQPNSDYSAGHRGVDLRVFDGQPVLAPSAGVIRFSGWVAGRKIISVENAAGLRWELEPVCAVGLISGLQVSKADYLGNVCLKTSANAAGSVANNLSHCQIKQCLHFSIKRRSALGQWKYLSPMAFIGALAPSRLKLWDAPIYNPA
jgi:hypothetical protein